MGFRPAGQREIDRLPKDGLTSLISKNAALSFEQDIANSNRRLMGRGHMKSRLDKLMEWLLRIVCAIALVFVGFAHQAPAIAADRTDPANFVEYTLPDGTLPTLCVTVTDADGKTTTGGKLHNHGCEACRIGASVLVPAPADVSGSAVAFLIRADAPVRVEAFRRQIYPPNTGPRAPPSNPILS